ncbi:TRAP transporter permease [Bacteroidota bacterium]
MAKVVATVAVTFSVYHILYITGLIHRVRIFLDIPQHLAIHLGFMLAFIFLLVPAWSKARSGKIPWYDVVLLVIGVSWNLYILFNFTPLRIRGTAADLHLYEVVGSWLNMLIVMEATRRIMGWIVPGIAVFFLFYALFSEYFPGFLRAAGHDWLRVGRAAGLFVTGMYGSLMNVSATIMFSFILFAQFLFITGAGKWFIDIAQAMFGHVRGGPAKVAVAASSLMGTISGSTIANVATTGVLTIPLMKSTGYRPHFAGAVEAAASNGGQIMPPIMGIAAFIMIDFLEMPYSSIILAALIPALAYYFALFLMVDFEAAKTGLKGLPRNELPDLRSTLIAGWQYIIPLAVLMLFLLVIRYSPELSALYSTATMVLIGFFNRRNPMTWHKIYLALKNTAVAMMLIAATLSVASIIVACVNLTGLSYRLSMGLVNISGGNVWLLLVLTAISCIILGMGMTTSAVYIMMATLVAPALISVGFNPIASHFYVFYFGVSAMVTPPVCPTSYVGAGIAGASPMRTGITAARLSIITFLAPLIFIFQPQLVMEGPLSAILLSTAYMATAVVALAGGLGGYLFESLNWGWRILFILSALTVVISPSITLMPVQLTNIVISASIAGLILLRFAMSRFRQ